MNNDIPRRVAIYARKSVVKDETTTSIENQTSSCEKYIKEKWPKAKIIKFADVGYSGKDTDRPDFQKMLEYIMNDKIDIVCVYMVDRISRSVNDFHDIFKIFDDHNVEFISINNNGLDTTNLTGKLMIEFLFYFAQIEREFISKRARDNQLSAAKIDGRWLGGTPPIGFTRTRPKNGVSTLVANEQMEVVIDLFQHYAYDNTISANDLTSYLFEKYGIERGASSIVQLLKNEKYVIADEKMYDYYDSMKVNFLNEKEEWDGHSACYVFNTQDHSNKSKPKMKPSSEWIVALSNWRGSIPSDMFLTVQRRLSQNSRNSSRKYIRKNLWKELQGMTKCPECGSSVSIQTHRSKDKVYQSVTCSRKRKIKGYSPCYIKYWKITPDMVRKNVADEIQKYLDKVEDRLEVKNRTVEKYDIKIEKLKKEMTPLIELVEKVGFEDNTEVVSRIKEKQKQIDKLKKEKTETQHNEEDLITLRVLGLKKSMSVSKVNYNDLSTEQKSQLLKILCSAIYINRDGSVDIDWKGRELEYLVDSKSGKINKELYENIQRIKEHYLKTKTDLIESGVSPQKADAWISSSILELEAEMRGEETERNKYFQNQIPEEFQPPELSEDEISDYYEKVFEEENKKLSGE